MKFTLFTIFIFTIICCNNKKERLVNSVAEKINYKNTTTETDSQKNVLKKDTSITPNKNNYQKAIIKPPPIPKIPEVWVNEPVKCFDPNININAAIQLINSGVEDTQWFIVENKAVSNQKNKLNFTDTILVQNELQKLGWKLIDSVQTTVGNQNIITLKMQNENRICNIEKKLFISKNKYQNIIEEWFQIRKSK